MKILIIKTFPGEIKTERLTYNIQEIGLAVALRKKGHKCDVMSISDDGIFHEQHTIIEEQDITVYSVEGFVVLKNRLADGYGAFLKIEVCQDRR